MKLNKKGFAFSTMLYGSVALIAAVLYLILNINKESVDTTYYFSEDILSDLNECVTEEIALENCYSSGASNCNPAAYHGCLGVSDNEGHTMGTLISNKLKEAAQNASNGIIEDPYEKGRYIFTGDNPKNYLSYSGKTWRIVSVESNGFLKLLDITKYGTLAWDTEGKGMWDDSSSLYALLNNNYLTTISDPSKLFQGAWVKSIVYPSRTTPYNLYNLVGLVASQGVNEEIIGDEEANQDLTNVTYAKAGLLYLSDYMKATGNNACKSDVFAIDINTNNCNSWLTEYKGWVININGEQGSDTVGFGYYIGSRTDTYTNPNQTVNKNNVTVVSETNVTKDVYPVIYLDRNSVYLTGDGSLSSPYTLK